MKPRTKAQTEALLGLSQGYLSNPKSTASRRVQAGIELLRLLDEERDRSRRLGRYLSLLDQVFPDVAGDTDSELLAGYRERLERLTTERGKTK